LNMLSGTAFTAPTNTYAKLHTGDPGSAGTANASAETTRKLMTWSAAASGSKAITTTLPSWTSWSAGAETLSHVSVWDAPTAGNFLYSFAVTTPRSVSNGDTVNLNSHSIGISPVAA
jgi:hypothetical protein